MSTEIKNAARDIRDHLVHSTLKSIQNAITFAATYTAKDPQLGAKLTAIKVAADDAVSYIDSRLKNG